MELEKYNSYIEKAIKCHPNEWLKPVSEGCFIVTTNSTHNSRCYRIISCNVVNDEKWCYETKQMVKEIDKFHVEVKGVEYDPFNECDVDYSHPFILNNEISRFYQVFNNKEELISYFKQGIESIECGNSDFLKEHYRNRDEYNDNENSNELVTLTSKNSYINAKNETLASLDEMEKRLAVINICIEQQRKKYDSIRRTCDEAITLVRRKVTRIERALGQIELYLGVNENIIQIQKGAPASIDEPITFYQDVLYMDEEVGDYKDGGLDFTKIEQFDDWLLRNGHLDLFLPNRGVRVFRVRRMGKRGVNERYGEHYVRNPYLRNELDREDKQTYIIIRNGDNVYRIWADIVIYPYLFPKQDELQKLLDMYETSKNSYNERRNKESVEDFIDKYQFNFCLLQGLLDRSDVLAPHNPINLYKDGIDTQYLKFVYDAENKQITDGHLSYWEFVKTVNQDIKIGSRIVLLGDYLKSTEDNFDIRFYSSRRYSGDSYGLPNPPETNIYTVDKNSDGEFIIRYLPKKEYYWEKDRKNKISFKIDITDRYVINYDALDIETVEYYLNNRINRVDYLDIMPMLDTLRKKLGEEKVLEEAFKLMLKSQVDNVSDGLIDETIKWWKMKNKVKRPLTSNDELAYKQILSKIKKFM